jgi:ketosteroid isomerase-like protein
MPRAAWLTGAALLALAGALAENPAAGDEQAILEAAAQAREASRTFDVDKLEPLLAPDFLAIDPSGEMRDKSAFLEMIRAVPPELRAANAALKVAQTDLRVRQYGDVAVLTERRDVHHPTEPSAARYTQVWVRHQGRWRLTTFQVTRVAKTAQPV